MVKAKTSSNDAWKHLYRALLRSSAASVRFSRPAARNTRRYLRDEFVGALVADQQVAATRPSNNLSSIAGVGKSNAPVSPELLRRQTHNTLAFHLSASLLRSSTVERRESSAVTASAPDDLDRNNTSSSSRGMQHTESLSPPEHPTSTNTMTTPSTEAVPRYTQPTTKTTRLPQRVVSNLSSLTYHHLSPHTQMQSHAHLKQNRTRKPQKLSSLARVLGKIEADVSIEPMQGASTDVGLEGVLSGGSGQYGGPGRGAGGAGETVLNALHMKLGFLMPSAKPARGPVSARLKEWDGQDADKIASEGSLRQMQSDLATVERLLQQHDADADAKRGGATKQPSLAKQVQQLKAEAEQLRRKIKSASKALAQVQAREQLENIAVDHLADLVAAAQDSEQVMLGKRRWMMRKRGEFLPP
ncbi:hypothetical protein EX895_005205 [Sporisorium graminicola]|uniref:Uncharacterized protein n=1 Tax=Sporisorium graminicola TaxID=280036 RepID=A0A4U7KMP9_9BASI|nr:hypothetical protein EX895_005205 [Sporisorium graminicola]TKY85665.1 hypothetical protein EX895_005205 [Sporisorium graminicola]